MILYAVPFFLVSLLVEGWLVRRQGLRGYESRDTAASLTMGVGNLVIGFALHGGRFALFLWLYEYRWFDLGTGLAAWILVFLVEDFTYYWWHRWSHEVRFLWSAHENHHSSQRYNLSTALRQSWTTPFTTLLVYWPLPLLGIDPAMLLVASTVSLVYQFWIHTETIERLGWFEWLFNTPSHHRVHHGSNVEYLDRNHGGILIVWDRLFGTFEPEVAPVRYGLTKNIETYNPLRIAFHDWVDMFRQVAAARSWRERIAYVLAPPGWSPDGSTLTATQLRAGRQPKAAMALAGGGESLPG